MRLADWLSIRLKAWTATGPSGPFGGHATLTDSLVSYWTLDESSGTRVDSIVASGNDLTDNNTVGSAAGMFNDAASFVSLNSEYLSNASTPTLQGGITDFTIAGWINTDLAAVGYVLSRNNTADYALRITAGGTLQWAVNSFSRSVSSVATVNDSAWHHFAVWYDRVGTTIYVSIDGAAPQSTSGAAAWDPIDAANFRFGTWNGAADFYNGLIDEVGFWTRVLTVDERTDLYAGSAGLFYGS